LAKEAACPFHSSDHQRSLRVQVHSGRFVCFAWGYMAEARARWREEQERQAAFQAAGVGYAAASTWLHPAREWRGGRMVCPYTTLDGYLVNLYGRVVGTAEHVPKAT
jgi:hypothetical protein